MKNRVVPPSTPQPSKRRWPSIKALLDWPKDRLCQAERHWAAGRSTNAVLHALQGSWPGFGERARRHHLLQGLALWSLGKVDSARVAFQAADRAHQPLWKRFFLSRIQKHLPRPLSAWQRRVVDSSPEAVHLRQALAMGALETEPTQAWRWLVEAVPLAWEDPMLLEELMLLGLDGLQRQDQAPSLGVQELHPELPYVFEQSLEWLMRRHGDPRIPWDRTLPARYLALKGRHREAVALALSLPPWQRSQMLWEVFIGSLRQLGDFSGCRDSLAQALDLFPLSFRLWMEQFYACMEAQDQVQGREALEHAGRLLPPATQGALRWEWLVQRAGFAHWFDHDPEHAWELLEAIPEQARGSRLPLLRTQVLVALGEYEAAHEELRPLLERQSTEMEFQLLEAEILAGLEAWEALKAYTEGMDSLRSRGDYWHLRGLALAHLKELEPARDALERASYLSQSNLRFVLDAGHACMDLYELERAELHWRQALRLEPTCEEALIQLSETRRGLHDSEGARRLLRECLLHHPESEEAQTFLAELEAH